MPLHDVHRRQKANTLAIALGLVGLVILFFLVTLAKMDPEHGQ